MRESCKEQKKRIKLMLSASLSSVFSHKVHNIRFENQYVFYPIDNRTSSASVEVFN